MLQVAALSALTEAATGRTAKHSQVTHNIETPCVQKMIFFAPASFSMYTMP